MKWRFLIAPVRDAILWGLVLSSLSLGMTMVLLHILEAAR